MHFTTPVPAQPIAHRYLRLLVIKGVIIDGEDMDEITNTLDPIMNAVLVRHNMPSLRLIQFLDFDRYIFERDFAEYTLRTRTYWLLWQIRMLEANIVFCDEDFDSIYPFPNGP